MRLRTKAPLGPVEIAEGLAMPPVVMVTAEDCQGYDVELEVVRRAGRLVARQVVVRERPGGPAVTGEALRSLPIAKLTNVAADQVLSAEAVGNGIVRAALLVLTDELITRFHQSGPIDEALRYVAYLYRLALLTGQPPTRTVQRELRLPRSTAGRWVALARERGFLGRAEGIGKAGETDDGKR